MIGRRAILRAAGAAALAGKAAAAETVTLPFGNGGRPVVAYPQKRPLLRLTTRPPQLETPFAVFNDGAITPNDAFFVRYHLAGIPYDGIDPDTFRVDVKGLVERPLSFSLAELKAMPATEVVAVVQCSGNSRGFFEPRVAGGQAGNGLMGCARFAGVPLKTVLDRAGVKAGAVEVEFDGLDEPVMEGTPDFRKSLPIDHARDGEVMLIWSMNDADLPFLNGYPLRLGVPGYFGTYWLKHLNSITVLDHPSDNFWMTKAYRVPDNDCQCVPPGQTPAKTRPIARYTVRSFITSVQGGAQLPANADVTLRGIAFDGGSGIRSVAVSADGSKTWTDAKLGEDLGRYAFRPWTAHVGLTAGAHQLMSRATANSGETQPTEPRWNPAGYARNVVETVDVVAA